MSSLILTIISIALLASLVAASVNYVPWYIKPAERVAEATEQGLTRVQEAYRLLSAMNGGVGPEAQGEGAAAFQVALVAPVLKVNPPAPIGYSWSYHQHPVEANSRYSGLHYVCLSAPGVQTDTALEMGMRRAISIYSQEQAVLSDNCGDKTSKDSFVNAPVLTFFLVPTHHHNL